MSRPIVSTTGSELKVLGRVRGDGLGVELDIKDKDAKTVGIPLDGDWQVFVLMPVQHVNQLIEAAAVHRREEAPPQNEVGNQEGGPHTGENVTDIAQTSTTAAPAEQSKSRRRKAAH